MPFFWTRKQDPIVQVFAWMSRIVQSGDVIAVEEGGEIKFFQFDFPLYAGAQPRILPKYEKGGETFFIRTRNNLSVKKTTPDPADWISIFSSPRIAVWENKNRPHTVPPLRLGLSADERNELIRIARESIHVFLEKKEKSGNPQIIIPRLNLKTDVDVALWVDGSLRGSVVIEGAPLVDGVERAAVMACVDQRFKPVTSAEFDRAAIQITILHDLRITLSHEELNDDYIYGEKGYLMISSEKKGWFLPETLNNRKFTSLSEFLSALASEKAGISSQATAREVLVFEVEDFISLSENKASLLRGPMIVKKNQKNLDQMAADMGNSAGNWLVRIQEQDGYIPPVIDVHRRISPRMDWARIALAAWALAEFGVTISNTSFIESSQKTFTYLKEYLLSGSYPQTHTPIFLCYLGRLSLVFKDQDILQIVLSKLKVDRSFLSLDTITLSQTASLLGMLNEKSTQHTSSILRQELRQRLARSRSTGGPVNLALFAELINVFRVADPQDGKNMEDWFVQLQKDDGSFPESTESQFSYSRGTAKIFEVLALNSEANREALVKSAEWLKNMQYDSENMFFVNPERRQSLLGGFRHDDQNPDAWIDSASHVLLGFGRILSSKKI